jgi:aminoglycoside phosphotransferase (APT) family kinase protein
MNDENGEAAGAGVDVAALSRWLERNVPALALPITVALLSGGRSNLTYQVTDATGAEYVLRRPPLGKLQATAHDVEREWGIVAALGQTPLPVAPAVAFCGDASVIGAPFFLMGFVGGRTIDNPAAAATLSLDARRHLTDDAIHVLYDLHAEDIDTLGLGSLARPGGYVERQLRRWGRQLDGYAELTTPLIREVQSALERRIPVQQRMALVHGDYKLGNLRVDADGRILAILDWELTAVGDPLADLGWLIASWAMPGDGSSWIVPPPTSAGGFPGHAALADAYETGSGLDLSDLDYYVAFSLWRWACINEGLQARFRAGAMGTKTVDLRAVEAQILWQAGWASQLLSGDATVRSASPGEVR